MPPERQHKIAERSKELCVEERLAALLSRVWQQKVSVKSTYARTNADVVAMASSLHMITTKIGVCSFAGSWNITTLGLSWLNEREHQ
jgi:hypothetical protein